MGLWHNEGGEGAARVGRGRLVLTTSVFFFLVKIKNARETCFLTFFGFFSRLQNHFHWHLLRDFHA